jgi:Voltage-dependent anion channel
VNASRSVPLPFENRVFCNFSFKSLPKDLSQTNESPFRIPNPWASTTLTSDSSDYSLCITSRLINSHCRFLWRPLLAWTCSEIMALDPGCFASVMATGIISNALFEEGRCELSDLLFFANAVVFPWLAILTVLRALRFPRVVWRDLTNPLSCFRSLPLSRVAMSSALASSCAALRLRLCMFGCSRSSCGSSLFISASEC